MAEETSDILLGSVQFVLSNWSVLQLAVENSFGGADTTEKAKWMVDVVNQVLRDNNTIENYELEDYIEEILFNEFDTMVEDGSLSKVAQKLCEFHRLWKEGKLLQMQQQISSAPVKKFTPAVKSKASAAHSDSDDDDNDEEQLRGTEVPCNGYHKDDRSNSSTINQQFNGLNISENNAQCQPSCSQTGATGNEVSSEHLTVQSMNQDEEEEGWEVVRRSKKR